MDANVRSLHWNPNRWRDLVLDVTVPLVFAVATAGFFVLALQ
jgi:hypothetical protein